MVLENAEECQQSLCVCGQNPLFAPIFSDIPAMLRVHVACPEMERPAAKSWFITICRGSGGMEVENTAACLWASFVWLCRGPLPAHNLTAQVASKAPPWRSLAYWVAQA